MSQEELEPERVDLINPRKRLLEEEVRIKIAGQRVIMTLEQHKVSSHIDDPTARIMIAQAPADTGKPCISALYTTILLQKTEEVVLVTAPTNLAVQKVTEIVLENAQLNNGDLIFLRSVANEFLINTTMAELQTSRNTATTPKCEESLSEYTIY